jgi:hypothetical protein
MVYVNVGFWENALLQQERQKRETKVHPHVPYSRVQLKFRASGLILGHVFIPY